MRSGTWSIATISFTIMLGPDTSWMTRIDHSNFRAYERRWNIKDRELFSTGYRFPGFFPRRDDLPASVVTALHAAYMADHMLPSELPAISKGAWDK